MANNIYQLPMINADTNAGTGAMAGASQSFSHAGTVFGELRKQILDQEQRAIENEYKNRALQQTIDAENRLHEYRMATAAETNRHNQATEAYYRGMLDYHNNHLDITRQLGEARNKILANQLQLRGEKGSKIRIDGGNYNLQDLFPEGGGSNPAQSAAPSVSTQGQSTPAIQPSPLGAAPVINGKTPATSNPANVDNAWREFLKISEDTLTRGPNNLTADERTATKARLDELRKIIPIDDFETDPNARRIMLGRAAELERAGSPLVTGDDNFDEDDENLLNPSGTINPNGNNQNVNVSKTPNRNPQLDSEDTWANAFSKDYVGEGLFSKNRADPTTFKERVAAGMQRTMSPLRPIADAARLYLNEPAEPKKEPLAVVYGNNLVEDAQGFYTNVDNFYKAIEKNKINNSNFDDFSRLNSNESEAMRRYGNSNNTVRNFGDNWFANTFFGSADTMVLSASATENKAQHELRATKELAALKQIYSSGDTDLQNFVLARLKQGAKSRNTEVAAKCKAGYKYLSSAINDTEYGTSVGGLQALDNMYLNLRFPTKENASNITAYQEKRTEKSKAQMETDKRLTRLMQDPLDFTKFGGNKQNLANAEYKKLREVVNTANHTDIPEDWRYGKTNRLARAAALQLTLNQLRTKDKLFFGNVVDANDRFFDVLQHAGNLKFFDKDTTEGSLFHEYYRAMYQMNPSEIKEFMQNIHSSNNQSSK